MGRKVILLALAYFAIALMMYNGRTLGFDEASRGMAGTFYLDFFSGVLGGRIAPGNFMDFVGNYHDHYKIVWDVAYFPPVQPLLMAASYFIFGVGARQSLIANALFASLLLIVLNRIVKSIYGKGSLLIPILLGFSPAIFFYARSAYYDIPMTFFYSLSFYLFLKWLEAPTLKLGLLTGLAVGAGFLVKYPAALALPAMLISIILAKKPVLSSLPIFAGFMLLSVPWLAVQTNPAIGTAYINNWISGSFYPELQEKPLNVIDILYSIGASISAVLSPPLAALAFAGLLLLAMSSFGSPPERKTKLSSLFCWLVVYLAVISSFGITHLEVNRYRYFMPATVLLVAAVGSLFERFRWSRKMLAVPVVLLLPFFAVQFEQSQSYYLPTEETADYFLAISNGATKEPIKLLVQDPTLAFSLRERDPQLKRFNVFYYPPTLRETKELLAGNSSSRSLKFFGLKSCGIGYATLINYDYGKADEKRHPAASEITENWRFDRIIKTDNGGSVEIYKAMNVTKC